MCWVCKGSSGAVAYQQTVLEIPGRVVAVKLRHDSHLSASSCQVSGSLEGRKGANPKPQARGERVTPVSDQVARY
ncbi:hypothetical protein EVAR_73241_1 [Eumeta japonica]|uniref:Uncharacterized protein n=1 Tax=Eumeta variegata TaxID=151549 RepID=A0A4C1T273_EUMVA|nr:hypothetical protein EVAR_73241_1 [Eumeta japonica]